MPAHASSYSQSFASAVQLGAMVEPDAGEPDMPRLLAEINALDVPPSDVLLSRSTLISLC
jgi:hypothetical protein